MRTGPDCVKGETSVHSFNLINYNHGKESKARLGLTAEIRRTVKICMYSTPYILDLRRTTKQQISIY